ncbi:MAG: hypothetical protein HY051_01805 [Candidatus Aenigmarchaeota archaeon]|nr:hypothetical protein [Candidatus Aenigmarchaeota archaeon]
MFGMFKKSAKKAAKTSGGKKKAFGGFSINFAGREETLEQVFGSKPIGPSEMTKRIWKFVKSRRLGSR